MFDLLKKKRNRFLNCRDHISYKEFALVNNFSIIRIVFGFEGPPPFKVPPDFGHWPRCTLVHNRDHKRVYQVFLFVFPSILCSRHQEDVIFDLRHILYNCTSLNYNRNCFFSRLHSFGYITPSIFFSSLPYFHHYFLSLVIYSCI